jgi:putative ABC transport system permease protein
MQEKRRFKMLKNNLKILLRNLLKNKLYSLINISGLAVAMAAFILIMLYVRYETNWDKFNENYDQIYRVELSRKDSDGRERSTDTYYPFADVLVKDYPGITNAARIRRIWWEFLSSSKDRIFYENEGYFADQSLFEIFTINFIKGSPRTALVEPMSIVLTEDLAQKCFPSEEPIGKTIRLNNKHDLKVTAIMENPPLNSHFQYSYFISFASHKIIRWDPANNWGNRFLQTYILLQDGIDKSELAKQVSWVLDRFIQNNDNKVHLVPLARIHVEPIETVLSLFAIFSVFGLLLACINYTNLATAYSTVRTREVGIRKTVGAKRWSLIKQFLGESIFFSVIALILAYVLAEIVLPLFNLIMHRELNIQYFDQWQFVVFMISMAIIIGIGSGFYPAILLSSFQPMKIFRGDSKWGKGTILRKGLVIFQFLISVVLIFGTIILWKQISFMKHKELGFDKQNLLITTIPASDKMNIENWQVLKHQLIQHPNIVNVALSEIVPFYGANSAVLKTEGASEQERIHFIRNAIDYDFIMTYGIKLRQGRNFSGQFSTDKTEACIINETAVKNFGWDDPIGKKLVSVDNKTYTVIGVVEDFHQYSLYMPIPAYFMTVKDNLRYDNAYSIKIAPHNIQNTRDFITQKFKSFFPGSPVDFKFLSEDLDKETLDIVSQIGETVAFFAILTIFIASIGLFGLVSFMAEQRTKEIGIRKALGASINQILKLLTIDFLKLLIIANLIGLPVAYFVSKGFLQDFAYRITFQPWMFLFTGCIALGIAMMSVSYVAIRASNKNPVEALRYE